MDKKAEKTGLILLLIIAIMIAGACGKSRQADHENSSTEVVQTVPNETETVETGEIKDEVTEEEESRSQETGAGIYSFLQGQKAWQKQKEWSGEWADYEEAGKVFGHFGCSFCCMANIYSTLSGKECSPLDLFSYTKEVTAYAPTAENAALGWGDMKTALEYAGISGELGNKPESMEAFETLMQQYRTAIVLISSNNDAAYWQNDGGHYVNIWDYNRATGEVFLADPGSPTKNRSNIPLQYVYDALKTSSSYQYLVIDGYSDETDQWKHDGITETWFR